MKTKTIRRAREAFTLIELLVVIAIIGILAALILPSLTKAKQKGKAISCVSNCRQWALAITLYEQDEGSYAPASGNSFDWTPGVGWYAPNTPMFWWNVIKPYYQNTNLWICPASKPGEVTNLHGQYPQYGMNAGHVQTNGAWSGWNSVNGLGQVSHLEPHVTSDEVISPAETLCVGDTGIP